MLTLFPLCLASGLVSPRKWPPYGGNCNPAWCLARPGILAGPFAFRLKSMRIFLIIFLSYPINVLGWQYSVIDGRYNCPEIDNSYECALYIERHELSDQSFFRRTDEKTIVLSLRNGEKIILENNNSEIDTRASFAVLEYIAKMDSVVVLRQYYEGAAYLLINLSSGVQKKLRGYPAVSPDGRSIVVADQDLFAGYNDNIFQVYRIEDEWRLEFEEEPTDWGPDQVKWIGNNCLSFIKVTVNSEHFEKRSLPLYINETMILRRASAGWKIVPGEGMQSDNNSAAPFLCQ